jgi:hypothetical protein
MDIPEGNKEAMLLNGFSQDTNKIFLDKDQYFKSSSNTLYYWQEKVCGAKFVIMCDDNKKQKKSVPNVAELNLVSTVNFFFCSLITTLWQSTLHFQNQWHKVYTNYEKKLALTSSTSGVRSVGIVHLWTEFF